MAPTYELALPEFNYLLEDLNKLGIVRNAWTPMHGQRAIVTALNQRIVTRSADDVMRLAAEAPGWVLACEAAQLPYEAFLRLCGRVAQKRGWLWMSGTFEGSVGWYPEKFTAWQSEKNEDGGRSYSMPSWSNTYIYPGGRDDPEIKKLEALYGHDLFQERCGGVPCPLSSLIFKEFSYPTHVFDWCKYDPSVPVYVAVDPGYSGSHYSVNFIQEHPRAWTRQFIDLPDIPVTDVCVIGDLYLDHAVHEEVIQQCKLLPYWDKVKSGVGDIIMKSHPMADRAPVDVWRMQAGIFLRGQLVGIADGINRHHTFLKEPITAKPRLFFNPNCKGAPSEYGRWKRKEIGENLYGEPELKNCDAMKAIQYYLIDRFGRVDVTVQALPKKKAPPPYAFLD